MKSYIGLHYFQAWQDEQVAVYDCQERLFKYKYIGVTDIDEFIVPYAYTTIQELFVSTFNAYRLQWLKGDFGYFLSAPFLRREMGRVVWVPSF